MATHFPPAPRYIYVDRSIQISAHLQRVYFYSDDFSDFDFAANTGAHIKLFFPFEYQAQPILPTRNILGQITWPEGQKPIARTYTVRDFLVDEQLLVIDFVRHAEFGIAANWAVQAQTGDCLGLAGPGGQARFHPQADYWLLMGDLSALPMIAASLEQLPAHAKGHVWIEIEDQADQMALNYPKAIQLHWIQASISFEKSITAVCSALDWQTQQISVTLAGENSRVVALRKLFRQHYQVAKTHLYAVPYWKQGHSEESYHQERHRVMDTEP